MRIEYLVMSCALSACTLDPTSTSHEAIIFGSDDSFCAPQAPASAGAAMPAIAGGPIASVGEPARVWTWNGGNLTCPVGTNGVPSDNLCQVKFSATGAFKDWGPLREPGCDYECEARCNATSNGNAVIGDPAMSNIPNATLPNSYCATIAPMPAPDGSGLSITASVQQQIDNNIAGQPAFFVGTGIMYIAKTAGTDYAAWCNANALAKAKQLCAQGGGMFQSTVNVLGQACQPMPVLKNTALGFTMVD